MWFLTVLLLLWSPNVALCSTSNITNIRTSFNAGKQRVVIDIDSNDEPAYYVRKGRYELDLTIEGITTPEKAANFAELLSNTNYIQKASLMILAQEKETIMSIITKDKVSDDIFALAGPSRIVIDLERTTTVKGDKQ